MSAPAVAVIAYCPNCGSQLRLRRNRAEQSSFIGCAAYPKCRYTAEYNAIEQALAQQVIRLRETAHAAAERGDDAPVTARDLRSLLAWAHPDRHPSGHVDAHELGVRLTELLGRASASRRAA